MARLNWDAVQAPDFSAAMRGFELASNQIKGAFSGAREGVSEIDAGMDERVNRSILMELSKFQDAEKAKEALASGAIFDTISPEAKLRASASTIQAAMGRPTELLRQKTAEQDVQKGALEVEDLASLVPFNKDTRTRAMAERVLEDRSQPLYAALAGVTDMKARQAVMAQPEFAELMKELKPKQVEDIMRFGYARATEDLDYRGKELSVEGQVISNAGGRLGNTATEQRIRQGNWDYERGVESYQEARAVKTLVGKYMNFVGDTDQLMATINSSPDIPAHLKSTVFAAAKAELGLGPSNIAPEAIDPNDGIAGLPGQGAPATGGMFGADWKMGQTPGAARPGGRKHAGWDLNGLSVGTPIAMPMAGEVVRWKPNNGNAGHTLTVRYANGKEHTFMHLANVPKSFARPGARFGANQQIAFAGNTGNASTRGTNRAVLHVEGSAGDPRQMFQRQAPASQRVVPLSEVRAGIAAATQGVQSNVQNNAFGRLERAREKSWKDDSSVTEIAASLASGPLKGIPQQELETRISRLVQTGISPWMAGAALKEAKTSERTLWNYLPGTDDYTNKIDDRVVTTLVNGVSGTGGARTAQNLFNQRAVLQAAQTAETNFAAAERAYQQALVRQRAQPGFNVQPYKDAYVQRQLELRRAGTRLREMSNVGRN
jgi:hypothetical protein